MAYMEKYRKGRRIDVYISDADFQMLDDAAAYEGCTRSAIVREAIHLHLQNCVYTGKATDYISDLHK